MLLQRSSLVDFSHGLHQRAAARREGNDRSGSVPTEDTGVQSPGKRSRVGLHAAVASALGSEI